MNRREGAALGSGVLVAFIYNQIAASLGLEPMPAEVAPAAGAAVGYFVNWLQGLIEGNKDA